ncbi:MAG: NUDIX domain-containing protein [Bacteroidota bacterium]|nr:NUDIX domain-containing protein [Bacteroidota bacterium]
MKSKISAGLLLYRKTSMKPEVLLVHLGGPFWAKKDLGAWSIPKGELEEGEEPLAGAKREFREETGISVSGSFIPLSPVKLKSGKKIIAFALEHNLDLSIIRSNDFEMEWPPHSGKTQKFPEIDRAGWFTLKEAGLKIHPGQLSLLQEWAERHLAG